MARTNDKPTTRKAASKTNIEEKSSSDESVEKHPSDRKMAAKSTTTKTKVKTPKAKPSQKDPPDWPKQPDTPASDSDHVEVIQIVQDPYPAKPARATKTLCMKYYTQKAHYYQKKF